LSDAVGAPKVSEMYNGDAEQLHDNLQRVLEDVLAELSRVEDGVESSLAAGRIAVLFHTRGGGRSMAVTESFTRSAGHCHRVKRQE